MTMAWPSALCSTTSTTNMSFIGMPSYAHVQPRMAGPRLPVLDCLDSDQAALRTVLASDISLYSQRSPMPIPETASSNGFVARSQYGTAP